MVQHTEFRIVILRFIRGVFLLNVDSWPQKDDVRTENK